MLDAADEAALFSTMASRNLDDLHDTARIDFWSASSARADRNPWNFEDIG